MPQTGPMSWTTLFLLTTLMLGVYLIHTYFNISNLPEKMLNDFKDSKSFKWNGYKLILRLRPHF